MSHIINILDKLLQFGLGNKDTTLKFFSLLIIVQYVEREHFWNGNHTKQLYSIECRTREWYAVSLDCDRQLLRFFLGKAKLKLLLETVIRRTLEFITDGKSLICKRKNQGSSTVPCGTPESTSANKDNLASTMTLCLPPLEKWRSIAKCICQCYSVQAY